MKTKRQYIRLRIEFNFSLAEITHILARCCATYGAEVPASRKAALDTLREELRQGNQAGEDPAADEVVWKMGQALNRLFPEMQRVVLPGRCCCGHFEDTHSRHGQCECLNEDCVCTAYDEVFDDGKERSGE